MSLTESEATVAVETHFHSNWVETNIFWNQVPEFPTVGTEFVSFWMVPAGTLPSTIGNYAEFRARCIVQIDINVPASTGTRRAVELGDQVSALFLGVDVGGIIFNEKNIHQTVVGGFHRRILRFSGYYAYSH